MKLPFAERAIVEPEKVREYLLSPTHPVGRFKAAFFHALGYSSPADQVVAAFMTLYPRPVQRSCANLIGVRIITGPTRGPRGGLVR